MKREYDRDATEITLVVAVILLFSALKQKRTDPLPLFAVRRHHSSVHLYRLARNRATQ